MVRDKISNSHHWPEQIEKHSKIAVGLRQGEIKKEQPAEELQPMEQLDIF